MYNDSDYESLSSKEEVVNFLANENTTNSSIHDLQRGPIAEPVQGGFWLHGI